jgi:hypothetical protein
MLLAVALAAAPVSGVAAGTVPAVIAPGCDVSDATLSWGFKESFRAYLDSDIANGSWETSDGATYETPSFEWAGGTGRYNPSDGTGYIEFTGTVHFTGHDGLLDTTITDPFIRFDGGSGELLLDVSGPTMDGTPFSQEGVDFVTMPALVVEGDDAVRTVDAATALTADGAVAFPNYAEGEAFDPVALTLTVGKQCAGEIVTGDLIEPQPAGGPPVPLLIIAGALVAVAAIVLVFFVTRRRRA